MAIFSPPPNRLTALQKTMQLRARKALLSKAVTAEPLRPHIHRLQLLIDALALEIRLNSLHTPPHLEKQSAVAT